MTELRAGALIGGGKYRLERQIGEGGMGVVWLAKRTATDEPVAVKFLTASAAVRGEFRQRFKREAQATAAVKHPNVVQVREALDSEGDFPALVMEYLVGKTLSEVIAQGGALPLADVASMLLPVVSAVGTAHAAGIVHRDLKPENIFLVHTDDGTVQPKVLDFGLAKLLDGDLAKKGGGSTKTGAILGTPFYMSPEQASGERGIDARADVWALGIILYECLAGRVPVTGDNFGQFFRNLISGKIQPIAEVRPDLPSDVCEVIGKALQHDREARLVDLRELDEVLRKYTSVESLSFSAGREPVPSVPDLSSSSVMLEPTERMSTDALGSMKRNQTLRIESEPRISAGAGAGADVVSGARVSRPLSNSERLDVPPAPPRSVLVLSGSRRASSLVAVVVGTVVFAAVLGGLVVRRSSETRTKDSTSHPPEPKQAATPEAAAPLDAEAPLLAPEMATASASAVSAASATEPRPPPSASPARPIASAKHPLPTTKTTTSASTTSSAVPGMMQGGVAKDVPF